MRVITQIDFSNLLGQCQNVGRKPNLLSLRELLQNPNEGRFGVDTYIYASLPPENGDGLYRFYDWLRSEGFQVITKRAKRLPGGRIKADLDTYLILDAMELGFSIKPDVMTLVTGDGDYAPLCIKLRRMGIRVEVASLEQALARELVCAVQGVIDLSSWLETCEVLAGRSATEVGSDNVFDQGL